MSRGRLLWRAALATLLTGLFSPVAFTTLMFVVASINDPRSWNRGAVEFILIVSMFGTAVAIPAAAMLGLLVEWPKAAWLGQRSRGGFFPHLLLSIVGGAAIVLAWDLATRMLHPPAFEPTTGQSAWWWNPGLVGGVCSALLWWPLVIAPMRSRAR